MCPKDSSEMASVEGGAASGGSLALCRDVRWTTSDRGLSYYAEADGHDVHESSAAESPHLWVDGEHMTVEEAAALRDGLREGEWRATLTVAIDRHYQTRTANPSAWKAGDQCVLCGSFNTELENDVASCNTCGASEAA
jgi:hypothetical protein